MPDAPEPLAIVQAFVNLQDAQAGTDHAGTDQLTSPAALAGWLARHGLMGDGEPAGAADLGRALALREALRALLAANNGRTAEPGDYAQVNRALAGAEPVLRFLPGGHVEVGARAGGVTGALGHLLAIAFTAMTDGTWPRLKSCRADGCGRAFYDRSRNQSGVWCSMATCGSRMKMRAYYQRRRPAR